jgi:hypothetical protein
MSTKKKTATKKKPEPLWETLSQIDCSEHIEKKGGFNYLSWAWAWGILMEHCPEACFENHLNEDRYPCFFDSNGNAMVRVTLTVGEQSHTEDYPVLNYKNQAIKEPDAFAVNTALKRCLVKSMAYFGLGHYIYAGEDLPPQEVVPYDREWALGVISKRYEAHDEPKIYIDGILRWAKVDDVSILTDGQLSVLMESYGETNE